MWYFKKKSILQNNRYKEFISLQKILNMSLERSEQELVRRESLQKLRELGINPYPAEEFKTTASIEAIVSNFNDFDGKEVILAGRMMSRRIMGKASFAEILDSKGRIQVYFNRDEICPGEDLILTSNNDFTFSNYPDATSPGLAYFIYNSEPLSGNPFGPEFGGTVFTGDLAGNVTVPNTTLEPEYVYNFETSVLKSFKNKTFQTGLLNILTTLLFLEKNLKKLLYFKPKL